MQTIVYKSAQSLADDLGLPLGTLYAVSNSIGKHYRRVSVPKRSGGFRTLSVPDEVLKQIQRRICVRLLAYEPISEHATAYRPGGGVRENASVHVGKPLVLRLDIRHFFDSIRYAQVKERAFPKERYTEPLRILLTTLCYHKDALPQGAPTSPYLSNIVMLPLDLRIGEYCRAREIAYTRYSDDLTFSGDFDPAALVSFVSEVLRGEGFLLHPAKTSIANAGMRQSVTGVTVNRIPRASAEYRRALRQEIYYCERFGVKEHLAARASSETPAEYLAALSGRLSFALSISPRDPALLLLKEKLLRLLRAEPK